MKNIQISLLFILMPLFSVLAQHTFSICAVDTLTGEVGVAGASCVDNIMAPGSNGAVIISSIHPGKGAIHTQAAYLPANQTYGDTLMNRGYTCRQIIDSLLRHDAQGDTTQRQYGVVEIKSGHATSFGYTGPSCPTYKNQISGKNFSIQGNTLLGAKILDSMEARFIRTNGDLACKLMAAMQGAKVVGADSRCAPSGNSSLSSFLRVACPQDISPHYTLNLVVPEGPYGFEPIDSLQKLFNIAHPSCASPIVCSATGWMQNENDVWKSDVFPNPSGQHVTIRIAGDAEGGYTLEVFSVEGKLVLKKQTKNRQELVISKQEVGSGIFFYKISNAAGKGSKGKFEIL
jgi:uncharacterized Ntn-hydrolase superfamily protein